MAKQAEKIGYSITSFSHPNSVMLEIDGENYEAVSVTVAYAVNTIPVASCIVATGRNMRNLEQYAKIHKTADNLRQLRPAKIWIEPRGIIDNSGKEWPKGRRLLFEGRLCGISNKQTSNALGVVLHFKHWLMDMASSSALAGGLSSNFPLGLFGPAMGVAGRSGEKQQAIANISHLVNHVTVEGIVSRDVWVAVKAMLVETCLEKRLSFLGAVPAAIRNSAALRSNKLALSALDRIEGVYNSKTDKKDHGLPYKYSKPPVLSAAAKTYALIGQDIATFINNQPLESFSAHSLWEVLILQLLGPLGLVLVPTPERAMIVIDSSLLDTEVAMISPTHVLGIDDIAMLDVPIKAVGVFGSPLETTGATAFGLNKTPIGRFGGLFIDGSIPDDIGTLMTAPMPFWLRHVSVNGEYAKESYKPGATINTADDPAGGGGPGGDDKKQPGEILKNAQDIFNAYAQMLWANHALRGMDGSYLSPLRFDLAPGQLVRVSREFIERKPQGLGGDFDDLAADKIGYIHTITTTIDSQGRRAGTAFKLSHLRTDSDQVRGMALEAHPLYDAAEPKKIPLIDLDE